MQEVGQICAESVDKVQNRTGVGFMTSIPGLLMHYLLHLGQRQRHHICALWLRIGRRDPNQGTTFDLIYV